MTDEKRPEQAPVPEKDASDRDYEAPEIATLGTVGELTSANEHSLT
jgi:hypothetical protein